MEPDARITVRWSVSATWIVTAILHCLTARMGDREENVALGTDIGAAAASFAFFASGCAGSDSALYLGLSGVFAMVLSLLFVGAALGFTGGVVGPAGASPLRARYSARF